MELLDRQLNGQLPYCARGDDEPGGCVDDLPDETKVRIAASTMKRVVADTLGYAGCELIRTALGFAGCRGFPMEDVEERQKCVERAVALGRALIIGRRELAERSFSTKKWVWIDELIVMTGGKSLQPML